jgi:hypothetical protein
MEQEGRPEPTWRKGDSANHGMRRSVDEAESGDRREKYLAEGRDDRRGKSSGRERILRPHTTIWVARIGGMEDRKGNQSSDLERRCSEISRRSASSKDCQAYCLLFELEGIGKG